MEPAGMRAAGAYASAAIHLYSRLWMELEHMGVLFAGDCRPGSIERRLVTFRLELIVLLDACDSARWRALLLPRERLLLRASVQNLLDALALPFELLGPAAFTTAQDRLFDSVLEICAQPRNTASEFNS